MKRSKKTTILLTCIFLFIFAVFGGGTILSALGIQLPFMSSSDTTLNNPTNANSSGSPTETTNVIPFEIDDIKQESSKNNSSETENSNGKDITALPKEEDKSYVVELAGIHSGSSADNTSTSAPTQDTGTTSGSTSSVLPDSGTESPSGSLPSHTGTKLPSTRSEPPEPSGRGGSRSIPVQSIAVDQSEVTINRKNTLLLVATVTPQSATKKTVSWSTSNKEVATVDSTGKVTGIGAGTTTITATADQKTTTCEVTVVVLMDGIALNHTELAINKGSTEQLTAKITPEDTTEDKVITWTSSAPDIVGVDTTGKVTALKPGKAIVKASAVGASASCEITVLSPMTGIALDKSTLTLNRNTTDKLTVSFLPVDTTGGREVTWSSSAPEIVDVDQQGNVVAYSKGTATITARCGEFTASCDVTVIALIEGVYLDQTDMTIDRGTGSQLTASILPPDTTEDKTVVWTSSDSGVATVNSTGKVTGVKIGSAVITAKVGEHTATCDVKVVALIHNISLNKTELTLDRGTGEQLTPTFDPPDTTEDKTIVWSSSNPDVATVDSAGNVTAVQIGSASITAQVGTHTTTSDVKVVALIHSISLDKTDYTLDRGTAEKLTVAYDPPDTTEDKTVVWTSSNSDVATVDSTGMVTAVQIGSATITAQVGTHTTSCNVKIVALIHKISLDKTELTLDRGTTGQLTVGIDPPDTTEDKTVTWSTSNPDVATVDSSGKVTAIQIGTASITATIGEHTSSCTVNVVARIKSIALDKTSLTVDRGTTEQLTISYNPSDTTEDKTATWTSSNPSVATVDVSGKVTAVQIGSAVITANVGEHTASCNVTVVALIKSISLNKSSLTLDRGTTGQLSTIINPSDTTENKTAVWTSSNPDVATVDSSGKVSAMKVGSAIITSKVGAHTASCNISVVALIHNVTLNKIYINLEKGGMEQLTFTIDPLDTTENKTVVWSSSNSAIASVDSSGKVTAGTSQVGETIITAKVGTHTASCVVGVGVKYTVTTSMNSNNCTGSSIGFNNDGSGYFFATEDHSTDYQTAYGNIKITFSKPVQIPKNANNERVSLIVSSLDKEGNVRDLDASVSGMSVWNGNATKFITLGDTNYWITSSTSVSSLNLSFYTKLKKNYSKGIDGLVRVAWDKGGLVVFGTPLTGTTGYIDL